MFVLERWSRGPGAPSWVQSSCPRLQQSAECFTCLCSSITLVDHVSRKSSLRGASHRCRQAFWRHFFSFSKISHLNLLMLEKSQFQQNRIVSEDSDNGGVRCVSHTGPTSVESERKDEDESIALIAGPSSCGEHLW